jgi:hypothetical protein
MRTTVPASIALSLFIFSAASAQAVQLVNKPVGDRVHGWLSYGGWQMFADEFTLVSAATANHLAWYGFNVSAANTEPRHTFRVTMYENINGSPATSPFYNQLLGIIGGTPWMENDQGQPVFKYQSFIPPVDLNPGTYWISVITLDSDELDHWAWSHSIPAPPLDDIYYRFPARAWTRLLDEPDRNDQAFELAYVPEPSSLLAASWLMVVATRFGRTRSHGK